MHATTLRHNPREYLTLNLPRKSSSTPTRWQYVTHSRTPSEAVSKLSIARAVESFMRKYKTHCSEGRNVNRVTRFAKAIRKGEAFRLARGQWAVLPSSSQAFNSKMRTWRCTTADLVDVSSCSAPPWLYLKPCEARKY